MMRYLRLAAALFRYSLVREMMFKGNFLLWIMTDLAWFALQVILVNVIYAHTQEVAGWNREQMLLLVGTSMIVQQIFQFIFLINCMELSDNIRTGKMDFLILQPANSLFMATVRKFDPGSLVNIAVGVVFVVYAGFKLGLHPGPLQILMFLALVVNGVMVHFALMLAIVTLAFWITRAQGLVFGYYNLFHIARIPAEVFRGGVKFFFTLVLPMLVVANYPAGVLIRGLTSWNICWVFAWTAVLVWLSSRFFYFGMKNYTSASS